MGLRFGFREFRVGGILGLFRFRFRVVRFGFRVVGFGFSVYGIGFRA